MNVISHSHAYSLYPRATFEDRVSIYSQFSAQRMDDVQEGFEKYTKRGWKILPMPSAAAHLRPNSEFRNGPRYVGDSSSWIIPLEGLYEQDEIVPIEHRGVELPMGFGDDFVRGNGWHGNSSSGTLNISTKVFTSWYLEGQYCACPDFHWEIHYFLDGLGGSDYGRRDREFLGISHKLYKAYNAAVRPDCKFGPVTADLQSRVRNIVAKAFINSFRPESNVPYELCPKPPAVLELINVLSALCNVCSCTDLEISVSFALVYNYTDRSTITAGDDPRTIWTIVDVSQAELPDSQLWDLNRSLDKVLKPFNIQLWVRAIADQH
ncbi:hypothetical protein K435DRAFT_870484 [Dendrothele bispora CBS 962.96]|uniref:Uncharacterized protein n=1 Tax=Dendrothele bispora (strain CBS 962.96) TaxID=1314807 RepID=A0A4S8L6I5_DENBC|nr:hypothetical protein K435DRAFT_870484 [Dendrothele bispora CBS 962.96]